jgi:hypothetical protein
MGKKAILTLRERAGTLYLLLLFKGAEHQIQGNLKREK